MNALRSPRCVLAPRIRRAHVLCVRSKHTHKAWNEHFIAPRGQAAFIYGTAWKKDETKDLVKEALVAGFRCFDTAAQPKHYREELVGEALREAISDGIVKREQIYVQTKFTSPAGQWRDNMPYDPDARLSEQINLSVSRSLRNLSPPGKYISHLVYVDSLLLHSPLPTMKETLQAWTHLEPFVPKRARQIGISNVDLPTLETIYQKAKVKPSVVQNRFHAETGYDVPLRAFCKKHKIKYQSFWTLTGNLALLESQPVVTLAQEAEIVRPVALYALVMDLDILVLNGTTSADHMREDLSGIRTVGKWADKNEEEWKRIRAEFREIIGEDVRFPEDPKFRGLLRT